MNFATTGYRYCQNFVVVVVFSFSKQLNDLNDLNDDNELLQAEDLLHKKFPTFSVHLDGYFGVFTSASALDPYHSESVQQNINKRKPHNNKFIAIKVHVSRFPVVANEAIQELNSVPVNKYT